MDTIRYLTREQLSAVANPIRQQILDLLSTDEELSGRMLAERIVNPPSNLYFHLGVLADAGIVEVTKQVPRRGAVEKYYRSVARSFSLSPGALAVASTPGGTDVRDGILQVAAAGAEGAIASLSRSLAAGRIGRGDPAEPPAINIIRVRASAKQMAKIRKKLELLLRDLHSLEAGEEEAEEYLFYQLLFPEVPS
ncbi:MAG: helix-turn-helix domain-containing protein [Gemmatimonadota bacterium]